MPAETEILHPLGALSRSHEIDGTIVRLAAGQSGRISRGQMLAAGIGRGAIAKRIRSGLLIPLYPGVYAVGHADPGRRGALWAAWLFVGEDALFSHRTAAELHEVDFGSSPAISLTVPRKLHSRPGLRIHRGFVPADERTATSAGLPVSCLSRTLLDYAAVAADWQLERALEECEKRELGDAIGLDGILARYPGRRGAGRLRVQLARFRPGTGWTRGRLETAFLELLDAERIERGEANAHIETASGWFECDHIWRRQRLIVELDSRKHHDNWPAAERDAAKRRALSAAGWTVVVATWRQIHDRRRAAELAADVRHLLTEES